MDYWEDQLMDLLEFGFPLDFDRSLKLISVEDNNNSTKDCEEHVNHYLQEELDHGAILGPFKSKPIILLRYNSLPCGTECFIRRPRLQPTIKKNNRLELAESMF